MCVCVCTLDNMFSQNNGKIAICCSVVCFCLVFFFLSNFCLLKAKQDCVLTMTSLKKKSLLFAFAAKYQYFFCVCVCLCMYFMVFFLFCHHHHHNINNKETYVYQHSFLVLLSKG